MPVNWGQVGSNAFTLIVFGFIFWIIYMKVNGSKLSLGKLFGK